MQTLLQWASEYFTVAMYLQATKIQGIFWSAADIMLVYYFLKIAALCDGDPNRAKMTARYALLWVSALLTPLLLITQTQDQYFILDAVICGIQYLILLYTLVRSGKGMTNHVLGVLRSPRAADSQARH